MTSIYAWSYSDANSNANADSACPWQENMAAKNVNNDARGTMLRVAQFVRDIGGAISAGGTANGLTVTVGSPFTAYANGQIIAFRATATNTGATTLNVNGIGAKAIRRTGASADVALTAGTIVSGGIYVAQYSTAANGGAGAWVLVNPTFDALFSPLAGSSSITTVGTVTTGTWNGGDVASTGTLQALGGSGSVKGDGSTIILAPDSGSSVTSGNSIRLRPQGTASSTFETVINAATGAMTVNGAVSATSFSGAGTSLTALNASNLGSGTVPSARMSGTYTGITTIGTQASITVTADAQNLGTIGRSTSNPWSIRWGGASGGLYVGGSNDNNFIIGTAADPSSNRAFYVDSTQTITYGEFRPQGSIFPAAGVQYRQDNGTNTTTAFLYTRSNTATATVWSFNNNTTGSPPDGTQRGSISIGSTSVTYATSSDYRLKENVADFTTSGEIIDALRPVSYVWKDVGEPGIGFIAHEVQEVFPDAVIGEKDGEQMQGGDWSKLVPILVAELKAVRARLAALESAA